MKKLVLVLGVALLFASCQDAPWLRGGDDDFEPQDVVFTEIAQGSLTGDALVFNDTCSGNHYGNGEGCHNGEGYGYGYGNHGQDGQGGGHHGHGHHGGNGGVCDSTGWGGGNCDSTGFGGGICQNDSCQNYHHNHNYGGNGGHCGYYCPDSTLTDFSFVWHGMEMVITNDAVWQNLMNYMNSVTPNTTATFAETDINFDDYYVLVVFDEIQETEGTITMTGITENLTHVMVAVDDVDTETPLVCQPFHIVKIAKTSKPIVFD